MTQREKDGDMAPPRLRLVTNDGVDDAPEAQEAIELARALAEAEERRRLAAEKAPLPREINGRGGQEPTRYGDWEVKGIISDF